MKREEITTSRCNNVFIPPRVNVHQHTNSRPNLCTIRENDHHAALYRGVSTRVFVPPRKCAPCRSTDPELDCFVELSHDRAVVHSEVIIDVCFLSLLVTHKPQGACRWRRMQSENIAAFVTKAYRYRYPLEPYGKGIGIGIGRYISDVTCSAGFWRKCTASHCVECMAQLSDTTIRAIVLRMLLLTALAPWQADRGSLELSIDACFVKIGQGDHLLRLLCGLWSCFSTCSVRRFLESAASVLSKRSLIGVCSDERFGAVCFCFGRVDRKRASVGCCMRWWNGRKTQVTTSLERSAVALQFPFISFWERSTRLTTLQRCRRTVHRDYLWAMVWVLLELASFIKDAQGLTWGALHVRIGS